ncbi:MAG: type II secretion system protein [Opitutus sp.]
MSARLSSWSGRKRDGFTLIELIGVMAIMAIMASVLVPNVLKSIDRAAVAAEAQTLHQLGSQVKLYLQANAVPPSTAIPPTVPNWTTQLATYADLNAADVAKNRRQVARTYVLEPVTGPAVSGRALLISSMRSGLVPPAATSINTLARFDDIWQTPDGTVPTGASAALWSGWSAVSGSGEYLLVERINLLSVYKTDFASFTVILVNKSVSKIVSYQLVLASGAVQPVVNLPYSVPPAAAVPPVTLTMTAKDRLNLYGKAGAVTLDFSYSGGSTNKTFYYTDTGGWLPP